LWLVDISTDSDSRNFLKTTDSGSVSVDQALGGARVQHRLPAKRVVLIDDDPTFRMLVRAVLSRIDGVFLCGEAVDGASGIKEIESKQPDLVLVDWLMPGMSGLDMIRDLRQAHNFTRIILCTAHPEHQLPHNLITLGVQGYFDKGSSLAIIESALRAVLNGGIFFASVVGPEPGAYAAMEARQHGKAGLPEALAILPAAHLSPREREVARR
jgi:DNA-binding NarL/FixJ family response regulator